MSKSNMEIPGLPTDNLYKFMALSGILMVILINYFVFSNNYKYRLEIRKINGEVDLLENDTTALKIANENYNHTRYVFSQYIFQKYKTHNFFFKDQDSLLSLDNIYLLALRNSALMPAYEKIEDLYN